ncbi:MAG: ABC transporter substrate-binding protein [Desulfohalobiaceae bacterium]
MVEDQLGRRVVLDGHPERIVCLAPNLTEIVFELGQGERVVGATTYSNHPPVAAKLPRVGSYVRLDLELIAALKPDLCLATKDGNPLGAVKRIESLGIPVFAVDPRGLDGLMDAIMSLAGLLRAEEKGRELVRGMQSRLALVRERVSLARHVPRVFYQVGTGPIVAAGRGAFAHELIQAAGGRNVVSQDMAYPRLSMEEVVVLSPEVIILSTMGGEDDAAAFFSALSRWNSIPAVAHGRIHRVESDLFDRPSPRTVAAVEALAALLHPDLFPGGDTGPDPEAAR